MDTADAATEAQSGAGPDVRPEAGPALEVLVEHLAAAVRLRFGGARRGTGPDTLAAAAGIGISRRQLERWLAGAAQPSPTSLLKLAAALRPPADVLAREHDDARNADLAHRTIGAPRGRGLRRQWRDQFWHYPHAVLIAAHPLLGIRRVAVVRYAHRPLNDAVRIKPRWSTPDGVWPVEDHVVVANHFAGELIRRQVLDQVDHWRVVVNPAVMPVGGTQAWLDVAPAVELGVIAKGFGLPVTRRLEGGQLS